MSELYSRYIALCEENRKLAGISFELTNFCNFSCPHCYRVHNNTFLDKYNFHKILAEATELGAILVNFNGGEPTIHPQFLDFSLAVLSRGMHLSVITNGSGVDNEIIEALTPWRKIVHFQISLYGTDSISGTDITGIPKSFESTLELIGKFLANDFDFRVSIMTLSTIADGIPQLIDYLFSRGIKIGLLSQLSAMENGNLSPLDFAATDHQILCIFRKENDLNRDKFIMGGEEDCRLSDNFSACNAGVTSLGIRADGRIVPCQVFTSPVLGHVSTDSLESVLRGPARAQFLASNVIPDKCRACDLFSHCMRCPADAMFETGELTGIPQESCRIARLRAKMHVDPK